MGTKKTEIIPYFHPSPSDYSNKNISMQHDSSPPFMKKDKNKGRKHEHENQPENEFGLISKLEQQSNGIAEVRVRVPFWPECFSPCSRFYLSSTYNGHYHLNRIAISCIHYIVSTNFVQTGAITTPVHSLENGCRNFRWLKV